MAMGPNNETTGYNEDIPYEEAIRYEIKGVPGSINYIQYEQDQFYTKEQEKKREESVKKHATIAIPITIFLAIAVMLLGLLGLGLM